MFFIDCRIFFEYKNNLLKIFATFENADFKKEYLISLTLLYIS